MKSKCLAAVVTVVRLSQCLQSKATKQLDLSWFKAAVERGQIQRGQIQIRSYQLLEIRKCMVARFTVLQGQLISYQQDSL